MDYRCFDCPDKDTCDGSMKEKCSNIIIRVQQRMLDRLVRSMVYKGCEKEPDKTEEISKDSKNRTDKAEELINKRCSCCDTVCKTCRYQGYQICSSCGEPNYPKYGPIHSFCYGCGRPITEAAKKSVREYFE